VLLLEVALCGASGMVELLGSCGGGVSITVGVVLKVCQRLCWGRWLSRRLGDCFLCIRRRCENVLLYLGVFLCFVVVISAWCCGWVRRSVSVLLGVWRSLMIGWLF
jgi:hypothetical protein